MKDLEMSNNRFALILNNKKKGLIYRFKVWRFKRKLLNSKFDFKTLWEFADFIKFSEFVYGYNNDVNTYLDNEIALFSSRNYNSSENGLKAHTKKYDIIVKLIKGKSNSTVFIEIRRTFANELTSYIEISEDGNLSNNTIENQLMIKQITSIVNARMLKLFTFCYNKN